MNRRVAAHRNYKPAAADESGSNKERQTAPASRAARAAARVAERYAHAPSYSDMLAVEARAAMRAAQAASRAADEAHEAAQSVLDGLEAATAEPAGEMDGESDSVSAQGTEPRNEMDIPYELFPVEEAGEFITSLERADAARSGESEPAAASRREQSPEIANATRAEAQEAASPIPSAAKDAPVQDGDPSQLVYGNLIQFPREMVATRKMRPRRAEGPLAATAQEAQLSIFEVDPESISTQPAAELEEPAAPAWMRTELESIAGEPESAAAPVEEPEPPAPAPVKMELAPMSRRLLAMVTDASLVAALFLAAVAIAGGHASTLPGPRAAALGSVLCLFAASAVYHALFFTLTGATPGMRYAGIRFSTFSGGRPNLAQRYARLMALALSVLPLGLGLVWALFDDGGLAWHDRLSSTYLRKG